MKLGTLALSVVALIFCSTLFVQTARAATCGNSLVETPETCDDGNAVSGDGCSSVCATEGLTQCLAPYDLLLLIDMSASVGGQTDVNIRAASSNLIDNFDFSKNRLSIAGQPGWKFFSNSGYISDKAALKAKVNYVTTTVSNQCFPAMASCGPLFDDDLRAFLTANKRQVNGLDVRQIVWIFNDGDVYQIPTGVDNSNYPAYNVNTYAGLSPFIDQWRAFINEYDVYWVRFPTGYTLKHPIWTSDNVMVKSSSNFFAVTGAAPANELYNTLNSSVGQSCVTPVPTATPSVNVCPGMTVSKTDVRLNDQITFTCVSSTAVPQYAFKIKKPSDTEGQVVYGTSNVSPLITIDTVGDYEAECRLCTGSTPDTCAAF